MTKEELLFMQENLEAIIKHAYDGERRMAGIDYAHIRGRAYELLSLIQKKLHDAK
jgi:hypothetical protein